MADSSCDTCTYFVFDEDYDGYVCLADMDEDDYIRFQGLKDKGCPFYRLDDEYNGYRKSK